VVTAVRHDSPDPHADKVARIVAQLEAHRGVRPLSLHKKSVSHQVPKAHDLRHHDDKIDVSELTEILLIAPVRRICVAESGVTFVDLVHETLKHGLVPVVVPELATITIGGAVSGCSIESMSFARGGFHDNCREYEVITATGDVLTCTPQNEHRLVFEMMHGSFGTLGILSKLVFELVPAKPFVHHPRCVSRCAPAARGSRPSAARGHQDPCRARARPRDVHRRRTRVGIPRRRRPTGPPQQRAR